MKGAEADFFDSSGYSIWNRYLPGDAIWVLIRVKKFSTSSSMQKMDDFAVSIYTILELICCSMFCCGSRVGPSRPSKEPPKMDDIVFDLDS